MTVPQVSISPAARPGRLTPAGWRELLAFAPLYGLVTYLQLILRLWFTNSWFNGTLAENHRLLLAFQYYNNEQSRVLAFLIPEALTRLTGISIVSTYMIQRLAFVLLAFLAFHAFLRRWFSPGASLAGCLFLAGVMPLTYMNMLQESTPLLMLLFLLALWMIRDRRDGWFALALWLGSLTNETILIVPVVYFFYHWEWPGRRGLGCPAVRGWLRLGLRTALLALPAFATQAALRTLTRDRPHLGGDLVNWQYNWEGILAALRAPLWTLYEQPFLFFVLIYSVVWVYALLAYRRGGRFLQRALWMAPLFVLAHLITGKINEVRQMLPLAYVAIPLGWHYLFPPGSRDLDPE